MLRCGEVCKSRVILMLNYVMMLLWRQQRAVHGYRLYWQRRRRHDCYRLPCQRPVDEQTQQRPQHAQLRRQLRLRLAGHRAGTARLRRWPRRQRTGSRCPPEPGRRRRRSVECRRTVLLRLRCQVPDTERQVLLRVRHGAPLVTSLGAADCVTRDVTRSAPPHPAGRMNRLFGRCRWLR